MALAYIDSCVLIYALEDDPRFGTPAIAALSRLKAQHRQPVISPLVRLECLVHPIAQADGGRLHRYHSFLSLFQSLSIRDAAFELATELRAAHRLRTPDALHLAAALQHGCQVLLTNDTRLNKAAGSLEVLTLTGS